ncbi:putative adenosine deaminase-like protein [Trypanosoma rangeli]|uniref:tRNA-specific adenosine deaminase 1 n=1 Tax=Trypanosoma rangeli TaxID=5698 RepID=A0A422NGA7_TRYRA|nr:putative adenosine deaminase-like protein [Trypanosoma rangeli]RNF04477.1 putative adenosine deaminase-like protein [Trypanosoma rangeli]|eukprot:RNF04477.1 putative adenosine deaminase-like protein [Trypanosoma rangeli]
MDGFFGEAPVADSLLEAFAASLLSQPARDGWYRNAISALDGDGPVIAGVVLQLPSSSVGDKGKAKFVCVSLGSGTRCVGYKPSLYSAEADPLIRDGHAEVMARRGFVAFLLDAALYLAQSEIRQHPVVARCHLTRKGSEEASRGEAPWRCFCLRDGVTVHLICTEYPCGAMSIPGGGGRVLLSTPSGQSLFPSANIDSAPKEEGVLSFSCDATESAIDQTIVAYGHVVAAHRSHPADEILFVGRLKPGKGHQNLCMSCSDKLLRWHCLGIQGRRRTRLFPKPMRLASVWLPQTHAFTPDAAADKDITPSRSFSLETARNALNDRIHYFHPMTLFKGRNKIPKEASQLFHNVPVPSPVSFHGFTPSFLQSLLTKGAASVDSRGKKDYDGEGNNGRSDSGWSRSAWLKMILGGTSDSRYIAGTKRQREANTSEGSIHAFSWREGGVAVLNTKAGLPRGVTKQVAERTVHQLPKLQLALLAGDGDHSCTTNDAALEVGAEQFPLSRLWMAHQQRRVLRCLKQQQNDMSLESFFVVPKDNAQRHDGDMTINSFSLPVVLFPVERVEDEEAVVAGGSARYWLRRARQCRKAMVRTGSSERDVSGYIPLLWVEKGASV